MSKPTHYRQHDELMQLVVKAAKSSDLISAVIVVTVGRDGRPAVGSNIESPALISDILRQLGEAEDSIEGVVEVAVPKDN